ncbi:MULTISPECIES: glycosyltransferase family 4 protein [unclassified Leucobacter]|uniref:glycosyltransferase family 4 protein n=1 Tax=unclassified Leucobacter TaxID=2621730 RepID=UPI00165E9A55|nr:MULTISPECIES: glycosyltransferase family 4 protein [unclassified Leucobacter]MBC9936616.1 glycosyltransferase family 4 protein [Leucobacter sp. cx-87]
MKIAFVVNNFLPKVGGMEYHIASLAEQLVARGHEVIVLDLGARSGTRTLRGFEVHTFRETPQIGGVLGFPLPGTRRRITRYLRSRGVDILSTHTRFFPMSFVGLRVAKRLGVPVVHTEHGSDYVASRSRIISAASRMVDRTFGRAVLRGANRVLGVSEEVCAFVERLAGVKAQLFYNAITLYERPAEEALSRPEQFVFVGRIVPGKGWGDYLELLRRLRARGYQVRGEVLGDGADMRALMDSITELALGNDVNVRGRIDPSEVRDVLRGATLVNPTVLSEGFQTTLLEAIAEGGRVLTYPVPGAKTLLDEGAPVRIARQRNVLALEEAAIALLEEPPERASPELIESWTWTARADEYLDVCGQLLGRAPNSL